MICFCILQPCRAPDSDLTGVVDSQSAKGLFKVILVNPYIYINSDSFHYFRLLLHCMFYNRSPAGNLLTIFGINGCKALLHPISRSLTRFIKRCTSSNKSELNWDLLVVISNKNDSIYHYSVMLINFEEIILPFFD